MLVMIDSRHSQVSSPFDFYASFEEFGRLNRVERVELRGVCLPKVANENYVLLRLGDFNTDFKTTSALTTHEDYFCTVYFDNVPTGVSKPLKGLISFPR